MANEDHNYTSLGVNAGATSGSGAAFAKRERSTEAGGGGGRGLLLDKSTYKLWVLAALLLLAFWSMLTGSVTLKGSTGNLAGFSTRDLLDSTSYEDLDILEIEEREKVVRHMWDVYTYSKNVGLPRFWQDAFRAAYEELASDVSGVRDAAVAEIAKMSLRSTVSDPLALTTIYDMNNDNTRATSRKLF